MKTNCLSEQGHLPVITLLGTKNNEDFPFTGNQVDPILLSHPKLPDYLCCQKKRGERVLRFVTVSI